jgi:hypothetical protein
MEQKSGTEKQNLFSLLDLFHIPEFMILVTAMARMRTEPISYPAQLIPGFAANSTGIQSQALFLTPATGR